MYGVFAAACIFYIGVIHSVVDLTQYAIHVFTCFISTPHALRFLVLHNYLGEYTFLVSR